MRSFFGAENIGKIQPNPIYVCIHTQTQAFDSQTQAFDSQTSVWGLKCAIGIKNIWKETETGGSGSLFSVATIADMLNC